MQLDRFASVSQGKGKKKRPHGATLQDDSPMQHMLPDNVASKLSEHEVLTLFEKMLVSDNTDWGGFLPNLL